MVFVVRGRLKGSSEKRGTLFRRGSGEGGGVRTFKTRKEAQRFKKFVSSDFDASIEQKAPRKPRTKLSQSNLVRGTLIGR